MNKKSTLKNYNKSDLIYDTNHGVYLIGDAKNLAEFLNEIDKFSDLKPHTRSELYNYFVGKYFEYYGLEKETKEKLGLKFKHINLKIKDINLVNFIMKHQIKIMKKKNM